MMKSGTPRVLRTLNEGAVLDALFRHQTLTRPEIESITGLSKPAAARLLLRVEEAGVVVRAGEKPSRSGPPAVLWRVNPRAALVAGIAVTADSFTVEVRDLGGELIGEASMPNPVRVSEEIAPALFGLIQAALKDTATQIDEISDVTVGLPGVIDPESGVLRRSRRLLAWLGVDVIGVLGELMPHAAVRTVNDVSLALIAEAEHGVAQDISSVALMWIGTGTKVAYRRDGEVMLGPHGAAGEIGSLIVPAFGMTGTTQAVVPGGGVLLEHLLGPEALDALEGDTRALAERVAVGASAIITLLEPDLIVIAGSVGERHGAALASEVHEILHCLPHDLPDVASSSLGTRAPLLGAVCLSENSAKSRLIKSGSDTNILPSASAR